MNKILLKHAQNKNTRSKLTAVALIPALTLFWAVAQLAPPKVALGDSPSPQITRLAGSDRYETANRIADAGWRTSENAVLARGDDFPDALAGSVLAHSPKVNGPLLLTEPDQLTPSTAAEIKKLNVKKIYLLGGEGAIRASVAKTLEGMGLEVKRITGIDRYATAAAIATEAVTSSSNAYLAYGEQFADALSISSYAASQRIPLLLTQSDQVPASTAKALQALGVKSVTLIGGEGVIRPSVKRQLEAMHIQVDRLSGIDRYATNLAVLSTLQFHPAKVYVATGLNFPDALAGAALAAQDTSPILLIAPSGMNSATLSYINDRRSAGAAFNLLGGIGVVPYSIERLIKTGTLTNLVSLQFWQGYSYNGYLNELTTIPAPVTDYVDFVAPNWFRLATANGGTPDGSLSGVWDGETPNYVKLVQAAQGLGLKVLPVITSDWTDEGKGAVEKVLTNSTTRDNLVSNIVKMVASTGADGVVIDFEYVSNATGPYLTELMRSLYDRMHAQNKLVIMSVMAKTATTENWYSAFNYHDLAQYTDYLDVMSYDYSTSAPGPVAPIAWVRKVLDYTAGQGVPMEKVLMGVPYYGRDWTKTGDSYSRSSLDLTDALQTAANYGATIERETSDADPTGIAHFNYTDGSGAQHFVYYEDPASLERKLALVDEYGLGGIGGWSLYWIDTDTAGKFYPLIHKYLR